MRKPVRSRCAKSLRFPRGEKFSGSIEHRGLQRWVGTFATQREWREAARRIEGDLASERQSTIGRRRRRIPSVAEYLGLTVDDAGLMTRIPGRQPWPWTHPRQATKQSSLRTLHYAVRGFASDHGQRAVDSFDRVEAREIASRMSNAQKAGVRRLFGDLVDDGYLERNPFERITVKHVSRLQRGDFRLVTDDEFSCLLGAALASRSDEYGLAIHAAIALEGSIGIRPSEIFGLEFEHLDRRGGFAELRHQIDSYGQPTPLKNSERRLVPLPPSVLEALERMPRLSERWVFAAPRGGVMKLSAWDRYWHPVRAMAGLPTLQFYELKHRAITRMCTPVPHGLGLDPIDVARIVGHRDGGKTITRHYLRLDERQAMQRFQAAWAGD